MWHYLTLIQQTDCILTDKGGKTLMIPVLTYHSHVPAKKGRLLAPLLQAYHLKLGHQIQKAEKKIAYSPTDQFSVSQKNSSLLIVTIEK